LGGRDAVGWVSRLGEATPSVIKRRTENGRGEVFESRVGNSKKTTEGEAIFKDDRIKKEEGVEQLVVDHGVADSNGHKQKTTPKRYNGKSRQRARQPS